ncbi:MAG: fibronectin type III domain-containing protein [Spirochaetaceae bacterium]|nr:fibronectin type III domain-containing protein [Spirochaetaceae bacterium]
MKNFFKVTSLILLVLFAASCSNGLLSTAYNSQTNDNGKCLVSFSITNFPNARTILPTDPEESMIAKYKISGTSGRGETYTDDELLPSEDKVMVLSYALWDLTLEAYDSADNLILKGRTIQDLSNGASAPITFTLSEKGVDTKGDVTLEGTYTDLTPSVVDYTISGLYDIHTGELVTGTTENTEENAGEFSYSTTSLTLAPGEYIFKVQLMGYGVNGAIGGDDDVQYGVWSDVVKVAPGRTTEKTDIAIPESVLGSLPADPEDLMAYLVDDSENNDETYKVNLKWTDKSNNETHFLIKVYEYSDKDTKIDDVVAEYKVLSSITETEIDLKLGKLYDVTIEAVNRLGSSTVVDRVTATGAETGETAYVFASADANYRINRFKITYDLDGGSYDDGTITTQNNVVNYHTYGATPVTLPQSGDGGITIKNGENPLQNWVKSDDSSDVDTDAGTAGIQYDGFANLAVTAVYDLSYEFTVTLPEYAKYELPAGNITVTFDSVDQTITANAIAAPFDVSTGNGGNKDIVLTIAETNATDATIEYDEFKVILLGGNKTSSLPIDLNGNTYTINTKNLDSGNYIMVAIAKAKDTNDWYSYSFSFTIAR